MPMPEIRISKHAREQMAERGITEQMVFSIVEAPQQTIPLDEERVVVITVYRTSKVEKYWQDENEI